MAVFFNFAHLNTIRKLREELKKTLRHLAFIADVNYRSKSINTVRKFKDVILIIRQEAGLELNTNKALLCVYVSSTECRKYQPLKKVAKTNHI